MNEGFGNVDAKTAMRMMMDEMMGQNRDATEEEKMEKMHKVYDRGTDKMFTCWGVSVWKLFKDTKSQDWAFNAYRKRGDGDPTDLEASQDCRKQWLELTQEQRDAYGYERELYLLLDDLVTQCDGKIERNLSRIESLHVSVRCCRKRLRFSPSSRSQVSQNVDEDAVRMLDIQRKLKEKIDMAEQLGEEVCGCAPRCLLSTLTRRLCRARWTIQWRSCKRWRP
jgi:hypothetical protein